MAGVEQASRVPATLGLLFEINAVGGDFSRDGFVGLVHEAATDVGTVAGKLLGDFRLVDPVQIPDAPVELLERVLGGAPVPVGLLVAGHRVLATPEPRVPNYNIRLGGLGARPTG